MNRKLVVRFLLVLCFVGFTQSDDAKRLLFAYEDKENYPAFVGNGTEIPSQPGTYVELLTSVTQKLGWKLELVRQPWSRVVNNLATGQVDAINGSYKDERAAFAEYPRLSDGTLNTEQYITRDAYVLYVPAGSSLRWNGKDGFESEGNRIPTIGVPRGYSVSDELRRKGVAVFENNGGFDALVQMMLAGRVDGIVVHERPMQYFLLDKPQWMAQIEKTEPAVQAKNYYILLSQKFVAKDPAAAQAFWRTLAEVRETELDDLYKKYERLNR